MATDPIPATLSFLTDAAHLLLSTSPETSAHLLSQRNSLMVENDLSLSDVQRQHVCGCCGHIMIPGQGDWLKMKRNIVGTRRKRVSVTKQKGKELPPKKGCQKTFTCSKCGRYTKLDFEAPARITRRRLSHQVSKVTTRSTESDMPSKPRSIPTLAADEPQRKLTANASSKKRAKNRRQGLQALLQQSTESKPQGSLGLSLADFMQH
ncbi:hypothetical protein F5Y17DRAFT_227509 [Xylariaceae sp. FL0594]|nr:hypothetical protein F5Y17DRAFT_227509 [Xylariaceae sp. FL0594]